MEQGIPRCTGPNETRAHVQRRTDRSDNWAAYDEQVEWWFDKNHGERTSQGRLQQTELWKRLLHLLWIHRYRFFKGTKAESDDENEEEAESDSGSDSSSSDDENSVKPTSAIQRRATMPRRRAAQKAAKFDFSSDSSDFENSEDDFNLND